MGLFRGFQGIFTQHAHTKSFLSICIFSTSPARRMLALIQVYPLLDISMNTWTRVRPLALAHPSVCLPRHRCVCGGESSSECVQTVAQISERPFFILPCFQLQNVESRRRLSNRFSLSSCKMRLFHHGVCQLLKVLSSMTHFCPLTLSSPPAWHISSFAQSSFSTAHTWDMQILPQSFVLNLLTSLRGLIWPVWLSWVIYTLW